MNVLVSSGADSQVLSFTIRKKLTIGLLYVTQVNFEVSNSTFCVVFDKLDL